MSRYRFLAELVSCFVVSCGNVPIKTSSISENISPEMSANQPPKNTWQSIKQLAELPDDCFNNVKEDKANLIKILPQTEAEFKDNSFTRERRKIYRSALKLYGAIAYNLQEKNKQLQAKCDQQCKDTQGKKEQLRSLFEQQKNKYQLELSKKDLIIENLRKEIQALKK